MTTKKEAMRQTHQENALLSLGFTTEEAARLRRISMTLHRWHELECGTDSVCITRGRIEDGDFVYDNNGTAFLEHGCVSGRGRYQRIAGREYGDTPVFSQRCLYPFLRLNA